MVSTRAATRRPHSRSLLRKRLARGESTPTSACSMITAACDANGAQAAKVQRQGQGADQVVWRCNAPARFARRGGLLGLPVGEYASKFNHAYETVVLVGFDGIGQTVDEGGLVDGTIQGWIVGISGGLKRSPWRKRRYKQGDRKCPARPPRR